MKFNIKLNLIYCVIKIKRESQLGMLSLPILGRQMMRLNYT